MATTPDILAIVKRRLGPTADADMLARLDVAVAQLSLTARTKLAQNIAQSDNRTRRELLRKDYTVTAAAGIADLSTLLADTEPALLDCLHCAEIYASTVTLPLQRKGDRSALRTELPTAFTYYAQFGNSIEIKHNNELGTFGEDLTITCNKVPTLANVPSILEEELADIIVGLLAIEPGGLGAAEVAEVS